MTEIVLSGERYLLRDGQWGRWLVDEWRRVYPTSVLGVLLTRYAAKCDAIERACQLIELGDQRLLASDGPVGGQPPDLSLDEWRRLYLMLEAVRHA